MKKAIIKVMSALAGGVVGAGASFVATSSVMGKNLKEKDEWFNKIVSYYHLYNQWLSIRQQGKSLVEYFEKNQYKTVAIYGMKELGERLFDELKDSDITVKYIIDKKADELYADIDIVTPDEKLEPVDVIVVTATYYFDEIEEMLSEKVEYPVISLEDIIYEV